MLDEAGSQVSGNSPSPLLTLEQVCQILCCKKSKLYELMSQGMIDSVKFGCLRFEQAAIESFIARHRRHGMSAAGA